METERHNQPQPLEHEDAARKERIRQIAPYIVFEHLMQQVDAGQLAREAAFDRMHRLTPVVAEGA